jgi:hypothetical protein
LAYPAAKADSVGTPENSQPVKCYSYAARVQTLMQTALRTVEHLQGLLDTLGGLVGNMQGESNARATHDRGE